MLSWRENKKVVTDVTLSETPLIVYKRVRQEALIPKAADIPTVRSRSATLKKTHETKGQDSKAYEEVLEESDADLIQRLLKTNLDDYHEDSSGDEFDYYERQLDSVEPKKNDAILYVDEDLNPYWGQNCGDLEEDGSDQSSDSNAEGYYANSYPDEEESSEFWSDSSEEVDSDFEEEDYY